MIAALSVAYVMNKIMDHDVYDSDDARATTPPLKQSLVDLRPYQSPPPPFLPDKSESPKGKESPSGRVRKDSHRRGKRRRTSIGIGLIIGNLAPDRPDLVAQLNQAPLLSDSASEISDADDGIDQRRRKQGSEEHRRNSQVYSPKMRANGANAPPREQTWPLPNETATLKKGQSFNDHDRIPYRIPMTQPSYPLPIHPSHNDNRDLTGGLMKRPEELVHRDQQRSQFSRGDLGSPTLPALQSPPQSIGSPDSARNLPSIKALVEGSLNEPVRLNGSKQSHFPILGTLEPQYMQPHFPRTSSFTHLSPASSKDVSSHASTPAAGVPQGSFWPAQLKSQSQSQSQSPGDTGSHLVGSPANGYPTPVEPRKDEPEDAAGLNKRVKPPVAQNLGGFKCTHPGCTADPFQTQYLLK
ncbi:hypothetical protein LOZ61_000747 [Ophidiomyces ophidiicola]|uniref:Uncharacterized protein n=1 Tax=Ophidiomyces ophidiicola TaxID=1387563 RepID=A0ACB8UQ35_9EURO|nr:uncharacterized protein LOZ57_001064 [Ophidiomyces ophidiicola]KAI1916845.1 hypothetical protein LOZ61_000747 [Ophidiomyces ophidiicola]KAI1917006.1 hypothetical protein LOZ64_003157 [Ophidiomyces ophidiicola]KAI1926721.1 hypothetical protein LOZ60_003424 [Ophidiomyces ophidiicola]KAI1948702.1 hypothetical protein LOZ59_006296 [Ophidiomyces ophidiicola]KAI1951653.1 hypothetical protein LOZ57_001064 [Ophidiomyces ophidiicola]